MTAARANEREHSTDGEQRWETRLAIRVPRDDGADVTTDATRRVGRAKGVRDVELLALGGLDPGLSATVAEVHMRVTLTETLDERRLRECLAAVAGCERVDVVTRSDC